MMLPWLGDIVRQTCPGKDVQGWHGRVLANLLCDARGDHPAVWSPCMMQECHVERCELVRTSFVRTHCAA